MKKQRLSRAESQILTKQRIVESASRLFLEKGFVGTSLEEVAREAGYTIGAIYSNFGNKVEIGIAVVDQLLTGLTRRVLDAFMEGDYENLSDALEGIWVALEPDWGSSSWTRLETEIMMSATKDHQFQMSIGHRYEQVQRLIRSALEKIYSIIGTPPPTDIDAKALSILGLIVGLGLQRTMNRDMPLAELKKSLLTSMEAIVVFDSSPEKVA
ncbi:TetR/AcrR family transcriptional regulator [Alcanivorax sp. NBRC 102024]|uniref:TetR/AcrR family transcriptional regulator n=1 Tax=Alcanivorax sp. NBRC 102024 TaxID=1113895 RepID=UPI000789C35E|nr:TetR/AcrR family transcriptional regulator [Alcanivorax sp. NBRC 102024]